MTQNSTLDSAASMLQFQQNSVRQIWGGMKGRICVVHSSCNPKRIIQKTLEELHKKDSVYGKSLSEMGMDESNITAFVSKIMKCNNLLVEGDMIATDHIVSTLRLLYDPMDISIKNSWELGDTVDLIKNNTQFMNKIKKDHIILICGPFGNLVTSILLEKAGLSWLFDPNENHSLRTSPNLNDGPVFEARFNSHDKILKDYGIFIRGRNPYNPSKRMYAIMGIHAYGTQGAAAFATNLKSASVISSLTDISHLNKLPEGLDNMVLVEVEREQASELGEFTDPALKYKIVHPIVDNYTAETYENPSQIFETQSILRMDLLENTMFLGARPSILLFFSFMLSVAVFLFSVFLLTDYHKVIIAVALFFVGFFAVKAFLSILMPPIQKKSKRKHL